jgi:hypothetical protein
MCFLKLLLLDLGVRLTPEIRRRRRLEKKKVGNNKAFLGAEFRNQGTGGRETSFYWLTFIKTSTSASGRMPASFSLLLISSSISEYTHAHREKHLIWELQNYGDGYNSNRTVEISDGSGKKLLMEFYLINYLFIYCRF